MADVRVFKNVLKVVEIDEPARQRRQVEQRPQRSSATIALRDPDAVVLNRL